MLRVSNPAPQSHPSEGFQLFPQCWSHPQWAGVPIQSSSYRLHPAPWAAQWPAFWPGGKVEGDRQRMAKGRNQLQQGSQIPLLDQGPLRKSRKKLQVIICVLLVELCERFTFFGIVCNMILFCTVKLGYDNYLAATVNLCFVGASTLTPVLVGWFAETCLGRTKVLYLCAVLHFFGKTIHCSTMQLGCTHGSF